MVWIRGVYRPSFRRHSHLPSALQRGSHRRLIGLLVALEDRLRVTPAAARVVSAAIAQATATA
jgi:hypothetical protein